jgi:hypothetical protein
MPFGDIALSRIDVPPENETALRANCAALAAGTAATARAERTNKPTVLQTTWQSSRINIASSLLGGAA